MSKFGSFIEEDILYNQAFHGGESRLYMLGIRIRLSNILTLAVKTLEITVDRGIKHIGNTQARLWVKCYAPFILKKISSNFA